MQIPAAWRVALLALPLTAAACVRVEKYDEAIDNLRAARADAAQRLEDAKRLGAIVAQLQQDVARLEQDLRAREQKLGEREVEHSNDQKRIDDLVALNNELSQRLKSVGQSVETLAGEKGALAKALADTKARLEELRRQEAAAEARSREIRELTARLQKLVDAGQLKVAMRGGRLLIVLPNDVLFDSGRTDLKEDGRRTLVEIAKVLRTMPDRRFQVAGHTDNVKINTARFPSNWELSTARAVEVVKLLVEGGMDARALSAAGYGEFDPVASNDAPDGRARNRRIEIALVPNLESLAPVAAPTAPPPAPQQPAAPHR
jgi:chemotaxis protein MotB